MFLPIKHRSWYAILGDFSNQPVGQARTMPPILFSQQRKPYYFIHLGMQEHCKHRLIGQASIVLIKSMTKKIKKPSPTFFPINLGSPQVFWHSFSSHCPSSLAPTG
jgi:hypothetical protein